MCVMFKMSTCNRVQPIHTIVWIETLFLSLYCSLIDVVELLAPTIVAVLISLHNASLFIYKRHYIFQSCINVQIIIISISICQMLLSNTM